MRIRIARPDDAPAIARLHVAVWRDTYRDMAPAAALAALDEGMRLTQWRATLGDDAQTVLVAEVSEAAGQARGQGGAGFISYGPPRHPAMAGRGEIAHLYVARPSRGLGFGRALLARARAGLAVAGWPDAALVVVAQNHAARAFYRCEGGIEGGGFTDPGPLWRSDNIIVNWPPLSDDPTPLTAR